MAAGDQEQSRGRRMIQLVLDAGVTRSSEPAGDILDMSDTDSTIVPSSRSSSSPERDIIEPETDSEEVGRPLIVTDDFVGYGSPYKKTEDPHPGDTHRAETATPPRDGADPRDQSSPRLPERPQLVAEPSSPEAKATKRSNDDPCPQSIKPIILLSDYPAKASRVTRKPVAKQSRTVDSSKSSTFQRSSCTNLKDLFAQKKTSVPSGNNPSHSTTRAPAISDCKPSFNFGNLECAYVLPSPDAIKTENVDIPNSSTHSAPASHQAEDSREWESEYMCESSTFQKSSCTNLKDLFAQKKTSVPSGNNPSSAPLNFGNLEYAYVLPSPDAIKTENVDIPKSSTHSAPASHQAEDSREWESAYMCANPIASSQGVSEAGGSTSSQITLFDDDPLECATQE